MESIHIMQENEQIKQSIVKNNIFMLGKLGIDLESPTCIVDLFNKLALFIEATEENKQTSKFLTELMENPNEKKYGIKESEFVPEDSESEECCTNPYSKQEIEDPPTADHPKTDKPTVNFPTIKLPEKAFEKRPTTLSELKRQVSEKLKDVTDGTSWLVNVPIARKLYEEALPELKDPNERKKVEEIISKYDETIENCDKYGIEIPGYSKDCEDLKVKVYDIVVKRSKEIFLHDIDHFEKIANPLIPQKQYVMVLKSPFFKSKLYVTLKKHEEIERLWKKWKDHNNG